MVFGPIVDRTTEFEGFPVAAAWNGGRFESQRILIQAVMAEKLPAMRLEYPRPDLRATRQR